MKKTLICLSFFIPSFVFAKTTLVSYPTDYETITTSGTTLVIYAGRTNNTVNTSCGSTGTCNTCALDTSVITANSVCGTAEVVPSHTISFVISSDSTTLNASSVGKILNTTNTNQNVTLSSYSTYATNSSLTITTTWGDLCNSVSGGNSNCTTSFSNTFNIGYNDGSSNLTEYITVQINFRYVDGAITAFQSFDCAAPVTGEGFCYFKMYPGDKKAYITPTFNPNNSTGVVADFSGGTGTDPSAMKYKYLRVLYVAGTSSTDTHAAHAASFTQAISNAKNLSFDPATGNVSPKKIEGLVNGNPTVASSIPYLFITASVDQAGLVTNYSDPSILCTAPYFDATQYATQDTQCVIPQKVSGLLDGQECFIATATYGSIMAPEVETFRKFRGEYLLKSELGKSFVRAYYQYSPPMAEFISQSESLKFISRGILFPLLIFIKLALWIGFIPTLFLSLLSFIGLLSIILRRKAQA